jgi:hypothetical protein
MTVYTTPMRKHRQDRRRRSLRFFFARLVAFFNRPIAWIRH